jgi:hypothetical protein
MTKTALGSVWSLLRALLPVLRSESLLLKVTLLATGSVELRHVGVPFLVPLNEWRVTALKGENPGFVEASHVPEPLAWNSRDGCGREACHVPGDLDNRSARLHFSLTAQEQSWLPTNDI